MKILGLRKFQNAAGATLLCVTVCIVRMISNCLKVSAENSRFIRMVWNPHTPAAQTAPTLQKWRWKLIASRVVKCHSAKSRPWADICATCEANSRAICFYQLRELWTILDKHCALTTPECSSSMPSNPPVSTAAAASQRCWCTDDVGLHCIPVLTFYAVGTERRCTWSPVRPGKKVWLHHCDTSRRIHCMVVCPQRMQYKLCLLVYKCSVNSPTYLSVVSVPVSLIRLGDLF